jgi:hypothetical protein
MLERVWDGSNLTSHFDELRRREFLYETSGEEGSVYVFKHALTQDVAYSSLLRDRRRSLRARVVETFEIASPFGKRHASIFMPPTAEGSDARG